MGLAAGANLNPERIYPSMFEPIHGSAPDIAHQGIANPLAAIWSASQILDFFGHEDWGAKVLGVIERVMVDKKSLTPDMGGEPLQKKSGMKWLHYYPLYKKSSIILMKNGHPAQ